MGLPIALNVFLTIDDDPANGSMSTNDLSVAVPICITSSESANIPISPGANIPMFAITHNSIAVVTNTPVFISFLIRLLFFAPKLYPMSGWHPPTICHI